MVNRVNDITWQAHQGSVAAIIQVLNEKLANSGIRTRAIFDNGVLQLLCEAHSIDKLKQSDLVQQIKLILNSIAPRNIRRVNINSRIVREQQLLWLKDISCNSQDKLLWSQEIILDKPNKIKQAIEDFQETQKPIFPQSLSPESLVSDSTTNRGETSFFRGMIFICGMIFSSLIAWRIYILFGNQIKIPNFQKTPPFVSRNTDSFFKSSQFEKNLGQKFKPETRAKIATFSKADYFKKAVRIANKTSLASKTVVTKQEWLQIAADWQKASDLMSNVEENDRQYDLAQNRVKLYQKYSEIARSKADQK
ncbi:MAG: hypothetical protein AAF208_07640 [Cyanobacteria bacterium P01_A01_bin.45]